MIFYFSGTGNTRWAAEILAQKTGERLMSIPEELKGDCHYTLEAGERIGFCFPVHGWQPPRIVRNFIERLSLNETTGHYCFALCTCGDTVGNTMNILNKDLNHRSLHATGLFSIVMPESYVCLPFMYTDTKEREQEKISIAEKQLTDIAKFIAERIDDDTQWLVKGATPRIYSYVIGEYFNRRMITDKPFRVSDNCIECGLCAEVCPTNDIIGGKGLKPEWRHNKSCTCCLACYHHCPVHAINYGKRTKNRGQYYFKKQQ